MNLISRLALLPVSTLLFLFSGFYKELVTTPVDLTIVAAALVCLSLLPNRRFLAGFLTLPVLLIAALNFWLALRLYPNFDPWGFRKLAEAVALGSPALAAGFVLSRDETQRVVFMKLLAYLSIPSAVYVILQTLEHPTFFSPLLGAGYQLTGMFFAFAMIASAVLANPYTMAASTIGVLVCGNITGFLFGGLAVAAVWAIKRDWKPIAQQVAAALGVIAVYTVLVAPPLGIERVLIVAFSITNTEPPAALTNTAPRHIPSFLKNIAPNQETLAEITRGSDARLDIWKSAVKGIKERPLLGWGYGNYDYGTATMAHNVLLELQTEGGFVASGLLYILLLCLFWCGWLSQNPFAAGCFILTTADLMISAYWGGRLSMFAFGLVAGSVALARLPAFRVPMDCNAAATGTDSSSVNGS